MSGFATNNRTPAPMLIVRSSTLPRRRRSSACFAWSRALCTELGPERSFNSPKESSSSLSWLFRAGVPNSESSGIPRLGEASPLGGVLVVLKRPWSGLGYPLRYLALFVLLLPLPVRACLMLLSPRLWPSSSSPSISLALSRRGTEAPFRLAGT